MQPHQQRVFDEANELKEKLDKLISFIDGNEVFKGLNAAQQLTLKAQAAAMGAYYGILELRIAEF
ncbi:crAss001_48 related protein [Yersinia enterocolitica]|nr:hypothetical protein [Yersinia enterocolitica]EKN3834170.1 hypothetical protein [Yersinia enterocolitica]